MIVRVYSTPTCPYCKMLKEFLKEKGIEFTDINVAEDTKKAEYIIEKTGNLGVPQTEIKENPQDKGIVILGFDKEKIKKALKIK